MVEKGSARPKKQDWEMLIILSAPLSKEIALTPFQIKSPRVELSSIQIWTSSHLSYIVPTKYFPSLQSSDFFTELEQERKESATLPASSFFT